MKKIYFLLSFLLFTAVEWTVCAQNAPASQPVVTDSVQAAPAAGLPAEQAQETAATEFSGEELAQKGDSAYQKDNFTAAEKFYLDAIKHGGTSPAVFYNLGNTYYRLGNLGKAVVNYERALKLDPSDTDARENLEFVQGKLTDRQIDDGSIMTNIWNNMVEWYKADTWAWIAILLFAVFIGCAAVYLFCEAVIVRKASFFGGIIVFLFTVVAVLISFSAANRVKSTDYAIILPPAAQLSTSPREAKSQSEQAFLLHEGTKVLIIDSIATGNDDKWYEVRVGARDRAWIKALEVERI